MFDPGLGSPFLKWLALLCLVLLISAGCGASQTPAPSDHLPITRPYLIFDAPVNANGGFEQMDGGQAVLGWEMRGLGKSQWERTQTTVYSGQSALSITLPPSGQTEEKAVLHSAAFGVQPGDAVKFNVWFRNEAAAYATPDVCVEVLIDGVWEPQRPAPQRWTVPVNEWFPLGKTVLAPSGGTAARLSLAVGSVAEAAVTWYVDDAFCEVISLKRYVEENADSERLKDILLIGADTLRQSPLGCYGGTTFTTPNIDMLAGEGVVYRHVLATSMWTRPSFASIFTSLYPSQHTAELHHSVLPDSVTTLAELLNKAGYFTVGFAKTRFDGFVGPGAGFAKGFDLFFHADDVQMIPELITRFLDANNDALSSLSGGGVFIFYHIFDPHAPYKNHFPELIVNKGLVQTYKEFDLRQELHGFVLWEKIYPQMPGIANEHDVEYARNLYYSEAWYTDKLVGDVLTRLRFMGLYDAMNIVLCADHGESFNEKEGVWNHGNPYNTCAEVPLIIRAPGWVRDGYREEEHLVTNLDIMPTLLTIAGAEIPGILEGDCLVSGEAWNKDRWGIAEDRKCGSLILRNTRYKLVVIPASLPVGESLQERYEAWQSTQPGIIDHAVTELELETVRDWSFTLPDSPARFELYDLEKDPYEQVDIAEMEPDIFHKMRIALFVHCLRAGITTMDDLKQASSLNLSEADISYLEVAEMDKGNVHVPEFRDLDLDTIERLRAEGYL